ncbi:MAG: tRNA 2-thiouridine(34) synthase MnmA [Clostridia bacterium]|nr:tRNA 2-thiouridine(34) synthase MnmA [Clostridia bacterium]
MEKSNTKTKSVLIGFSGGVDSATSTHLLKEMGFDVTAYHFSVSENDPALYEAKELASQLDIPFTHENLSKEFESIVITNFVNEYINGRTPNPCIVCNPNIKFKKLRETADRLGITYIATGHYASVTDTEKGRFISKAANLKKDQSYMLYRLPKAIVDTLIFPLSDFESKDEIRHIASETGLKNANKKDSQEICFTDSYIDFLNDKGVISKPGNFVDVNGKVIGTHKGIVNYTIGQRKGLGNTFGKPMFVLSIDEKKNTVVLGSNEDLFTTTVRSIDNFFINDDMQSYEGKMLEAKVRYTAKPAMCRLHIEGNEIYAEFDEPQRAVTPGQSIVFYDNDLVVGGGYIK